MNNVKRLSNIELLRIVAMILIMLCHIFQHSIGKQLFDQTYSSPGELFNNFVLYKRLSLVYFCRSGGQIGNSLFILISGYFLADKEHINLSKQLFKILSQVIWATCILTLLSYFIVLKSPMWTGVVTLSSFNQEWWFIGYYIFIIVLAELCINKQTAKNQTMFLMELFVLFAIVSMNWSRNILSGIAGGLDYLITGVFIYMLGGYIKRYNPFKKVKTIVLLLFLVVIIVLMSVSYNTFTLNAINRAIVEGRESYYQVEYASFDNFSIHCICISVILFELFSRLRIQTVGIINYIAECTFMMYIMHENPLWWGWEGKLKLLSILYDRDWVSFVSYLAVLIFLFSVIGILVYSLYKLFLRFVSTRCFRLPLDHHEKSV